MSANKCNEALYAVVSESMTKTIAEYGEVVSEGLAELKHSLDGNDQTIEKLGRVVDILCRRNDAGKRVIAAAWKIQVFVAGDDNYTDLNDPDPYAAQVELCLALEAYYKATNQEQTP